MIKRVSALLSSLIACLRQAGPKTVSGCYPLFYIHPVEEGKSSVTSVYTDRAYARESSPKALCFRQVANHLHLLV